MRALLSVANRDGIAELARDLTTLGVELFATDGTLGALRDAGVEAQPVTALTEKESLAGGQVRTFHPQIYAGILARRQVPEEITQLSEAGIGLIDLVIVNVKPFAPQLGTRTVPLDEAIEMIDVGGTALITAAARNYASVAAVSHTRHYSQLLEELRAMGAISPEFRQRLAADALADVATYFAEVAGYLNHIAGTRFPEHLAIVVQKVRDFPYGENPHQQAAFYRETTHRYGSLADATQVQGDQPTLNDLLDLNAAYRIATDFTAPTVCIVKQTNPTGIGSSDRLVEAYEKALAGDPVSAFGGVVALNREVDRETAAAIAENAYEAVVAPAFSAPAREVLAEKEHLGVLAVPNQPFEGLTEYGISRLDFQRIDGGLLVETRDRSELDRSQLKVVTRRRPTLEELTDLLFAWRTVRHVTSNAVVLARELAIVGVGAGQASRLTAVEIALHKAADRAKLSVLASDAYFPFADAIQLAAERGVTAIIQPGGSIRDEMAIEVADRHHMAMVFTGRRHYRR
ncbi:MAG TPA: bifunctional phosphoribosylaminoimidazolecarboxamide formyltransferase/IMP cyclohydrolase [Candidatus Limnocylindrales bacterium]|nr:bifunctional phosphoribosylaminoimidazolecarboxamide formyltransferase/IMP cyclohydrolase [Candidatus Limnocylindrales bacterium]